MRENFSSIFVDTAARGDRRDDVENQLRKATKVFLISWSEWLFMDTVQRRESELDDFFWSSSYRIKLCTILVTLFAGKTVFQLLAYMKRKVTLLEITVESGILYPLSFCLLGRSTSRWGDTPFRYYELVLYPVLFLGALYVQLDAEYSRCRFKSKPENHDKLYQESYFRMCQHINYTCEIVMLVTLSLATGSLLSLLIPLVCSLRIIMFSIPELNHYLRFRYRDEWVQYRRRTPAQLVPYTF
uniref:Steroid 5-alpha reductase C-terminal domain-containing protein n=1 Tax=Mucochytrium quahogii TaxID=96639 RepID=A0A7S2WQ26_9STRA|mmetsp:Transcript_5552/g.8624  ORF Transcript_5552/g.8624 Transcript_5552/m.8624 type:complete len:242 (-) Transcript_5552:25-750(-)|eukprot:CAMPEP_0203747566 /NCGR_PEP_ID=MMETSP0098-20131031/2676_1 /ASSEMBLY_ACC=CAM_ASM_000208 /TAXON_ID=96639 /ORGANISM=" , Strain NY0313808BC1" /LENGTH=241 /DNA_ID=CAMNT_0050636019 /DNA_START=252 /DNA_END=977 /DNA_ORIENTATION=-